MRAIGAERMQISCTQSLKCNAHVTVSVIMYDNESTYSSTSLQNNEHRVIAAHSYYETYRLYLTMYT